MGKTVCNGYGYKSVHDGKRWINYVYSELTGEYTQVSDIVMYKRMKSNEYSANEQEKPKTKKDYEAENARIGKIAEDFKEKKKD